jgi:hypothetical protein
MLRLDKVIKPWKESAALNDHINLYGFWNETAYKANEAPFDIQSIYHDDRFTYIKTSAPEKFSVYEMKDGKPNLVTYDLREGTYIIPKIMDSGYVELGKKRMEFTRKG